MKDKYLNNEIWILTFGGAFQRANIYKKNYQEKTRSIFRKKLRNEVERLVHDKYQKKVTEDKHIENIKSIVTFSKELKVGQVNIPINFGVAQKLLNLYLKYQWCLGKQKNEPPHFPVDRVIQQELNKIARKHKLTTQDIEPWTQFKDESKYKKVIDFAKYIRDEVDEYKDFSLAQLELENFNRI